MRALVLVILAFVVLQSGCTKTVYRHHDSSPQRWARDSYECERDAHQTSAGPDSYDRCLAARGWTKTQESDLTIIRR
jgi:hypothetical protein